jgi:tetratricopeptide (TPR) repeat protein
MKLSFATLCLLAACATPALALDATNETSRILYNVDASAQCSQTAANLADLQHGLSYCNEALGDPLMNHRAALLVDRGIIKFGMKQTGDALADFDAAIAMEPDLSNAYVNRAAAQLALGRDRSALADANMAIKLGGDSVHIAYFTRAAAEEDAGQTDAAYRDYKQALVLKPDFAAAQSQLTRFKVVPR